MTFHIPQYTGHFFKFTFTFTFMHLADAFIQSDLQCIQVIHVFISTCGPWESNPQPFALLTQATGTQEQVLKHFQFVNCNYTAKII